MNIWHSIRTFLFWVNIDCCVFGFVTTFSDLLLCFWICSEFIAAFFFFGLLMYFARIDQEQLYPCCSCKQLQGLQGFVPADSLLCQYVCVQWMGYEWGWVKHVIDTGNDVNCFAFQRNDYQCYYLVWQKVMCSMNPAGHMARLELWQMGPLLTHTLSEGQKFKPWQSLWKWWIGNSFCLTDNDKNC